MQTIVACFLTCFIFFAGAGHVVYRDHTNRDENMRLFAEANPDYSYSQYILAAYLLMLLTGVGMVITAGLIVTTFIP